MLSDKERKKQALAEAEIKMNALIDFCANNGLSTVVAVDNVEERKFICGWYGQYINVALLLCNSITSMCNRGREDAERERLRVEESKGGG